MRITVLVENTRLSDDLAARHGLSLYIETANERILFDTGVDDSLVGNAKKLKVDLSLVDFAVISHGHYDHGGGIPAFFTVNSHAPVYIHEKAFGSFYSTKSVEAPPHKYIGIDPDLKGHPRLIPLHEDRWLSPSLLLFTGVAQKKLPIESNRLLFTTSSDGSLVNDDFVHEMNLVIRGKHGDTLICGCAHNGVVNIIDHCRGLTGAVPSRVIGGFHLSHEQIGGQFLSAYADMLKESGVESFYTCHCTGESQFAFLNTIVQGLSYIRTGTVLEF
ncbi:MAG: MBL fold metallo-hydrolase [Spirochaetales bacterium]|nr:MBL fold metallo-hydrolase [Spirochaetales bacterium]